MQDAMTDETTPPAAQPGDELDAASMTRAASSLLDQANDVARRLGLSTKDSVTKKLLLQHEQLVADAITLNSGAIVLIAGEAKVEGAAIANKIATANETLKKIASTKRAIGILDTLIDFVAAVLTGSGTAIVEAVINLDKDLEKPKA